MKRYLLILMLASSFASTAIAVDFPDPADPETDSIFFEFDNTGSGGIVDLPARSPGCAYTQDLQDTIQGMGQLNFWDLFLVNKKAYDVVNTWYGNLPAGSNKKAPALALRDLIGSSSTKSFRQLIRLRLRKDYILGEPGYDVAQAIDVLYNAGFMFPLLKRSQAVPMASRFQFLINFRRFHSGVYSGGFGNLTFDEFFNTPAVKPTEARGFGDSKLFVYITGAQAYGVLPKPVLNCPPLAESAKDHKDSAKGKEDSTIDICDLALLVANDKCCCNTVSHTNVQPGPHSYRTCRTGNVGNNCNTCGSICCLAGVIWCAAGL